MKNELFVMSALFCAVLLLAGCGSEPPAKSAAAPQQSVAEKPPAPEPPAESAVDTSMWKTKQGNGGLVIIGYTGSDTAITIPATLGGVRVIGIEGGIQSSITGIENVTSITISEGIEYIRTYAFAFAPLTSVEMPDSIIDIGGGIFLSTKLTSVKIPDRVTFIGGRAFCGTQLTSVTIPDSVVEIGEWAFDIAHGLTSITIGSGLATCFNNGYHDYITTSFRNVFPRSGLTTINVDPKNPALRSIDNVLFSKDMTLLILYPQEKFGDYIIPDGVTTIGDSAFQGTQLTGVIIPDSVTTIGNSAFQGTQLTSVVIPDSVTTIGMAAFSGTQLTSVIIPDSVTFTTLVGGSQSPRWAFDAGVEIIRE
jgi:hypothetical protein